MNGYESTSCPLNENMLREVCPLPTVNDTLVQLAEVTVFSKLDANSGFLQVKLDDSSKDLTTFITSFGRFCFNKIPFGTKSGPEHFQLQMSKLLEGIEGVLV